MGYENLVGLKRTILMMNWRGNVVKATGLERNSSSAPDNKTTMGMLS